MIGDLRQIRNDLCMVAQVASRILVVIFVLFNVSESHAQDNLNTDILTAEERAWVQEHPVLRSTNDRTWAPIDFTRNGEAIGFSIDYLDLVASK